MPREIDARFIMERTSHLQGIWDDAHTNWKEIDSYYHQTNELWPKGVSRPALHTARATSIIDHAVDNFLSGEPRVHRNPAGVGKIHKERADMIEPWLQRMLIQTSMLEPIPTWKQVAKNMAMYGYSIVEGAVLSMSDMPEEPEQEKGESKADFNSRVSLYKNEKRTWMPFRVRAPHPARILLDPTEKEPREGVKRVSRYAIQLEEITAHKHGKIKDVELFDAKDEPYRLVECLEYWSKEWHALVADDKMLFKEKNTWGYVPFVHAFAGWGQESTDTNEPRPSDLAKGLLTPLLDDLKAQSQAFTGRQHALLESTFEKWGTTRDAAEIANQLKNGDIVDGINQGDIWKIHGQQLPGWLFEADANIDRDIEMGSFSRSLSGGRETGVSTVGQQAILSTAASKRFVTPSRQIEQMATIIGSRILRLMDVLDEPIQVGEFKIGPKEIDHDYGIDIRFELVDPVLQLEQRQLGMAEVNAGLKSKETYWAADAKLEDVQGEKMRMLSELVEESPEVVAILAQEVARRNGLLDLLQSLGADQGQGQGGSGLVNQQGNPLTGSDQTPGAAAAQLRQPLTGQATKPPRVNPAAFGR